MYLDPNPTQNPMWNEENRRHEIKKQYKVEIYDSIQCKKPIFVVFTFVQPGKDDCWRSCAESEMSSSAHRLARGNTDWNLTFTNYD